MDKKTSVLNVDLVLSKRTVLFGLIFSPGMGHADSVIKVISAKFAITRFTMQR